MAGPMSRLRVARAGVLSALVAAGLAVCTAGAAAADPTVLPSPTPTPTVTASGGAAPSTSSSASTSAAASASTSASASGTTGSGPAPVSGDVLDQLAEDYAVGSGGGQLSNLLKLSLKLRAMGFRPSKANLAEIAQAMDYRPNQIPLIDALKDTVAYQQKIRAQMEILQQYQQQQGSGSAVMGAGQMPGDSNPANLPGAPQPGASAPTTP